MHDDNMKQRRKAAPWGIGRLRRLAAGAIVCAATLSAQTFTLNPLTTGGAQLNGFHLYNFSAYTQYSTVDRAWFNQVDALSGAAPVSEPAYTTVSGVSASLGFRMGGGEDSLSDFSLLYSPVYSYTTFEQNLSQFTHSLSLSWSRKLTPRWRLSVSASGVYGVFDQFLFSPTNAQNLASLAGTVQDLAGAGATGQSGNSSIAAGTGASATITPQLQLFYGDRVLSAAAEAGLSYSYSPRLSLGVSASGSRMQHLKDTSSEGQGYYLIPQTTDVGAGGSFTYLLSERTSFSGSLQYARVLSSIDNSQYAAGLVGFGSRFTEHWFTNIAAGGGYILPVQSSASSQGKQWEASGKLGYRAHSNTLIATVNRSISDMYGAGAAATLSVAGGWNWRRPGMHWSLQAGVEEDRLSGQQVALLATTGIRVNAGLYRSLSLRANMVLQYTYDTFWGPIPTASQTAGPSLRYSQNAVRLNFGFGASGGGLASQGTASSAP